MWDIPSGSCHRALTRSLEPSIMGLKPRLHCDRALRFRVTAGAHCLTSPTGWSPFRQSHQIQEMVSESPKRLLGLSHPCSL
jgi:hypothetical protein